MIRLMGKKIGMTQIFDKSGNSVPVTIVEAGPCIVIKKINDGSAVQIAWGADKHSTKPVLGTLKKAGVEKNLKWFKQYKVVNVDEYTLGQEIKTDIFNVGDKVSVRGTSIGKGFAGTVKRHHFRRSPMSHGSKSHRIPGSIGAGTSPGHVVKGKRMAGRLGGERVTVKNLEIMEINLDKNLLFLRGAVPGHKEGFLEIGKA